MGLEGSPGEQRTAFQVGPRRGQRPRDVQTWRVLATGRYGHLKENCAEPGRKDQAGPEWSIVVIIGLTVLETHFHITCWMPGTLLGVRREKIHLAQFLPLWSLQPPEEKCYTHSNL